MNQSILLYSLSKAIKPLNTSLSDYILDINQDELETVLDNVKANGILFDKSCIKDILDITNHKKADENRFICIGEDLNSNDRLILLNHNIEFLTPEKYKEITPYFFKLGSNQNQQKVLLVEDDVSQILITEHILKNANIDVKSITKGEEVLDALDEFNPDLILMDLYLEGITGDKLVKVIRKEPSYKNLPIVFLTADTTIESRMQVLNAGADDLLTKPINPNLLVAALKNRMQRNVINERESNKSENKLTTVHSFEEVEQNSISDFIEKNNLNEKGSVIWLKVKNRHSLLKKLGFSGYKNICTILFNDLPTFNEKFDIKLILAEGVYVLANDNLNREKAQEWVKKLQKWLVSNYFSINQKDYYLDVIAIILSDIPQKKNKDSLVQKAENILIEGMTNQAITLLEEGIEEEVFYLVKTQIENAIKTRNFNWLYQTIVATKDDSQEIYQIMLNIITETGKELTSRDYLDVAMKSGLLRLLDRFTLEHAIRIIRAGEQKKIKTTALLNQILSDYKSTELRTKKLAIIKKLNLPVGSLLFQFTKENAEEYMSILGQVGRELHQANIKICLSNFDCSTVAWKIARKLNISWIRLRRFKKGDAILDKDNPHNISKVIRKAQILGYKVIVSNVDSAGLAADLWNLNIDFLQGDFIQTPTREVLDV